MSKVVGQQPTTLNGVLTSFSGCDFLKNSFHLPDDLGDPLEKRVHNIVMSEVSDTICGQDCDKG